MTNYQWRQGGAKAPRRLREGSMKQPRSNHEAITKQPRSNHGGSTKESRTFHDAVAAHLFCGCSGAITVASRSLHNFEKNPVQPQLPNGRLYRESAIPSAKPCGVSIFGLGLGLRLCKKISTEPPRLRYEDFAEPPAIRQIMTSPWTSAGSLEGLWWSASHNYSFILENLLQRKFYRAFCRPSVG